MRKIKSILVMVLILSLLLLGTIIGIIVTDGKRDEGTSQEEVIEEPVEEIITIPESFVDQIDNEAGVPEEIIDLITNYNDDYYMSIFTLEQVPTSDYFVYDVDGAISDSSIKLMLETRKLYDFDFTLTKAHYDLSFTDYYKTGDDYYVFFLMDEYMNFAFLDGITSETYDVENTMIIRQVDGEYKIVDYDKIQGYYMMFYDNDFDSVEDVDDIYDYYFKQMQRTIENEEYLKAQAETTEYVASKSYDVAYDRDAAVAYANKYYHSRNKDWYDFSNEGGNCQNYASQCLSAGDMIMDYYGSSQWKCYMSDGRYDPGLDYDNEPYGRTASWVQVSSFHDYCEYNEGTGLVADCDAYISYAEAGDIIQVGISSISHTTIVSQVVDGHILVNSNSIDMKDWPIEAYTYPTRKLIKILGSNY